MPARNPFPGNSPRVIVKRVSAGNGGRAQRGARLHPPGASGAGRFGPMGISQCQWTPPWYGPGAGSDPDNPENAAYVLTGAGRARGPSPRSRQRRRSANGGPGSILAKLLDHVLGTFRTEAGRVLSPTRTEGLDIDNHRVIVGLWTDECVLSTAYAGKSSRGYDVRGRPADAVRERPRPIRENWGAPQKVASSTVGQGGLDRRESCATSRRILSGPRKPLAPGGRASRHPDGRREGVRPHASGGMDAN